MAHPIAVVGVSALFPGSSDAEGFWRDIIAGRDLITDVPPTHWLVEDYYDPDPQAPDKTYCKRGGFLGDVDFDPMAFGVPPSIMPATDTAQLLALIVAQKVIEDACQGDFARLDRERVSCILGVTSGQELLGSMVSRLQRPVWRKALCESGLGEAEAQAICERIAANYVPWQESTFPGLLGNVVAGRIANRFGLHGTNCVTDAACASGLSALSMGVNELAVGQSDLVIAGGVDTMNDILMYVCFSKTPALSPSGDCRPFADDADGTLLGEGLLMVALRRLEDAERDGNRIYAVIRGLGSSSDGRAKSVYAPVPEGQARALRRAHDLAGYGPDTVELIEAHGTATKAGDVAEFAGLEQVFNESGRADRQWCALGSVKSQIGHTKATAGAAGLFKAVMALHHKVLPPTIKVSRPNTRLSIEKSPFYLNTQARPWIRESDHPRRAGVSSFGFGGSNFHVALEEYTGPGAQAWRLRTAPTELFLLSAASPAALAARGQELFAAAAESGLAEAARLSQRDFSPTHAARLAIIAGSAAELATRLEQGAARLASAEGQAFSLPGGVHGAVGAPVAGGIAFLFPGQGSQYVGMGTGLAMELDAARAVWDRVARVRFDGAAIHEVVFPRPVFSDTERDQQTRSLTATEWAQPAIALASLALLEVLRALGLDADCLGGHSFGEITALAAAGVFDSASLIAVARRRGELMRDAGTTPGAMIAVPRPIAEVRALLDEEPRGEVTIANHNHPAQVVLSGSIEGIRAIERILAARDIRSQPLPVATAFHSALVSPASAPFAAFLAELPFGTPDRVVYSNAEAGRYPHGADEIRAYLAEQLARPVRFVEQIEAMWLSGARVFVEVGPGSVLTDFVGRILENRPHVAVATDRRGRHGLTSLQEAIGRLAVAGLAMRFDALWNGQAPSARPKKKPAMNIRINGSNHGKLYPPPAGKAGRVEPGTRLVEPGVARGEAAMSRVEPMVAGRAESMGPVVAGQAESTVSQRAPVMAQMEPVVVAGRVEPVVAQVEPVARVEPVVSGRVESVVAGRVESMVARVEPAVAVSEVVDVSPLPRDVHLAWVQAYQETQRHVAEAQAAFQRTMAETHLAFFRTVESSFVGLQSIVTGQPLAAVSGVPSMAARPVMTSPAALAPIDVPSLPSLAPMSGALPSMSGPLPPSPIDVPSLPSLAPMSGALPAAAPSAPGLSPSASGPGGFGVGAAEPAGEALIPMVQAVRVPGVDLEALLLNIVADKTGYPVEMLGVDMALESDLGIDSIKRVEILSAMRERAPGLPEVATGEMAALRTLGQIIEHMRARGAASPAAILSSDAGVASSGGAIASPGGAVAASVPAPSIAAQSSLADGLGLSLEQLLLTVVAEKTGYPAEMLGVDMALESDLGIDSIKRVEILSAMRERAPGLPEVATGEMAALRTLGQIVDFMRRGVAAPTAPSATTASAGAPSAGAPSAGASPAAASSNGVKSAAASAASGGESIRRSVVVEIDAEPIHLAPAALVAAKRAVIVDDGTGVAGEVARQLVAIGLRADVVDRVPPGADAVVFLGGLRSVSEIDQALAIGREAFAAAQAAAPVLAEAGGLFVTVQDTGGDFGLSGGGDPARAWLGGLVGLARTAALEWPRATVRAIDLEQRGHTAEEIAARLVGELTLGGLESEIGLHLDGRRTALRDVAALAVPAAPVVDERSVLVVSGGARGVTAAAVAALVEETRARVVLLGRTELFDEPEECRGVDDEPGLKRALLARAQKEGRRITPAELSAEVARVAAGREIRATLAALTAAGGQARYLPVDVQDAGRLRDALDEVRRAWGPITGVVHGAGVLADRLIADKTPEQFERVFGTKVGGLRALLRATAADPLRLIALFSSVAARTGNPGQCDYAMANEVLNHVAAVERRRRGDDCVVKSIGWGPWEGGMVTPELKARFDQRQVPLLSLREGARRFVEEIHGSPDQVATVIAGSSFALAARGESPRAWAVHVDRRSHPFLADHVVAGDPVLPVAMAVEWFARAARGLAPGASGLAIRDLKVLRGIQLGGYDGDGDRFVIRVRPGGDAAGVVGLELCGGSGALHYSATVDLSGHWRAGGDLAAPPVKAWSQRTIYDGHVLFHGPSFQMIRAVEGVSQEGLVGTMVGLADLGWTSRGWHTDPVVLDGALQLAVLWAAHVVGEATLPMAIGSFVSRRSGPLASPLRGLVRRARVHSAGASCDVALVDGDGQLVAELRAVETVVRPARRSAIGSARAG